MLNGSCQVTSLQRMLALLPLDFPCTACARAPELRVPGAAHLPTCCLQVLGVSQRRLFDYGAGGIVGELDFFLQRQRSFKTSSAEETVLLCLQR